MDREYLKLLPFILVVIQIFLTSRISAQSDEATWTDPDAWARDHLVSRSLRITNDNCCKCSEKPLNNQQQAAEDSASLIYLKKIILMLFDRKNFKYDSTQQIYERSIVFTIQSCQMIKLEQLQDPRDLDNLLAEILKNSRTPNMYCDGQQDTTETSNALGTIVLNLLYDIVQLTKTSEIRFLLVVSIFALVAWTFHTRFNIGWLPLVFGIIFIYGYLHTYLECNRELEANKMLEILNLHEANEKTGEGSNVLKFLKDIFYSKNVEISQRQKIKQSAKLSFGFCRPDHVLIIYFNDIFLKYLQALVEQCTVTLTTLNSSLGFPYNILSGFLLVCMIGYIMKLTFKYIISPSAWADLLHRKQLHHSEEVDTKSIKNCQDDRISGDNLKLLLNAISAAPLRNEVAPKQSAVTTVSGIEEIKEPTESSSEKNLLLLDKTTDLKQKNNNLNEKPLDERKIILKMTPPVIPSV